MQQILIGNPLQLTEKGLLALHKLKYKETYCYKHTWKNIGIKDKYGEWDSLKFINDNIQTITEEEFVNSEPRIGANYYLLPVDLGSAKTDEFTKKLDNVVHPDNNNTSPHELLWFCSDWIYPKEEFRKDKDLIKLFNNDLRREFFDYENRPRTIVIPRDIKWYLDETDMGIEYIQEKARSWS